MRLQSFSEFLRYIQEDEEPLDRPKIKYKPLHRQTRPNCSTRPKTIPMKERTVIPYEDRVAIFNLRKQGHGIVEVSKRSGYLAKTIHRMDKTDHITAQHKADGTYHPPVKEKNRKKSEADPASVERAKAALASGVDRNTVARTYLKTSRLYANHPVHKEIIDSVPDSAHIKNRQPQDSGYLHSLGTIVSKRISKPRP